MLGLLRHSCLHRSFVTKVKGFAKPLFVHEGNMLSLSNDSNIDYLVVGKVKSTRPDGLHIDFEESPQMISRIISILRDNYMSSKYLQSMAANWHSGWMHIPDGRALAVFGRCPEADDIFATVQVIDGKMVKGSIQHMPTHRLLTVNGLFQLPGEFDKLLYTNQNKP